MAQKIPTDIQHIGHVLLDENGMDSKKKTQLYRLTTIGGPYNGKVWEEAISLADAKKWCKDRGLVDLRTR